MTDADYTDDLALLTNTQAQAKSHLHKLKQTVKGIGFYMNANNVF